MNKDNDLVVPVEAETVHEPTSKEKLDALVEEYLKRRAKRHAPSPMARRRAKIRRKAQRKARKATRRRNKR